jgi:two-component system cell cycle response regulator CtrA
MTTVIVSAPSRELTNELRRAAEGAGFESDGIPLPQDLCSVLYRDPDAMGIIRASNTAYAVAICTDFRRADVKNVLFVLLDEAAWEDSSPSLILRAGADDVQPAPIHADEFVARLKALARRGTYNDHLFIKMPGCTYDAASGFVETSDKRSRLAPAEAKLLTTLALDPARVFSKADLMDHLYGGEDEPEQKIIDVFVCKLRRKLVDLNNGLDVIRTIHGRGYQFDPRGFLPEYRRVRSGA